MASVEQRPGPIAAGDERRLLQETADALQSDRIRLAHDLYGDALAAATTDETRAEALIGLGHVAHRSGRPREALRLLEDALRLTEQEPWDRLDLADPIGRSYAAVGELERAATVFLQCGRRAQEEGDRLAHVPFAALLSYALTDQGKFDEAERALEEVLAAAAGNDDPDVHSLVEWAQARLRGEQGQTEVAVEHARTAFELLRTTQNTNFLALTYELLASLYNDLGRADEALDLLRDGWPL
jgi:tetratricopeptide (TPR) repeat protein